MYVCTYTCMLNKNTLGIKKCEANQKQHCKQVGATKNFDISLRRSRSHLSKEIYSIFYKYDWLCHLGTFMVQKGGRVKKPAIHYSMYVIQVV